MFAIEKEKNILYFYVTRYKYLLYVIRFILCLKYHEKLKKIIDILLIRIIIINIARCPCK